MGKGPAMLFRGRKAGYCIGCRREFVGPGERCQDCQQKLRARKRRKPR
jgi:rRNA maturation endonuclease Nob1